MSVPAEIPQPSVAELTGAQKVAILLMAVGEEASTEITKNLSPEEVESISFEIAKLRRVEPEVIEEIIHEWQHTEHAAFSLAHGGVDYASRILTKAFGEQKASSVLKRIEAQLHVDISLTHLRNADPKQLVAVLRNEHPQAIALTLAFLDAGQTASVIREFDPEIGSEILMRMARMEKVQPDCLRVIEEMMGSESDLSLSGDGSAAGGPVAVAEVLNLVAAGLEKELLDGVAEQDVELAEEIKKPDVRLRGHRQPRRHRCHQASPRCGYPGAGPRPQARQRGAQGEDPVHHVFACAGLPERGDGVPRTATRQRCRGGAGEHRRDGAGSRGGRRDRNRRRR